MGYAVAMHCRRLGSVCLVGHFLVGTREAFIDRDPRSERRIYRIHVCHYKLDETAELGSALEHGIWLLVYPPVGE